MACPDATRIRRQIAGRPREASLGRSVSPHYSPTQDGVPRSPGGFGARSHAGPAGEPWAVCRAGRRVRWRQERAQRGAADKPVNNAGQAFPTQWACLELGRAGLCAASACQTGRRLTSGSPDAFTRVWGSANAAFCQTTWTVGILGCDRQSKAFAQGDETQWSQSSRPRALAPRRSTRRVRRVP
jgi:hypothetical protein